MEVLFIVSLITILLLFAIAILFLFLEKKELTKLIYELEDKIYKLENPIRKYYIEFQTNDLIERKTKIMKTRNIQFDLDHLRLEKITDENNVTHTNVIKYKIVEVKE